MKLRISLLTILIVIASILAFVAVATETVPPSPFLPSSSSPPFFFGIGTETLTETCTSLSYSPVVESIIVTYPSASTELSTSAGVQSSGWLKWFTSTATVTVVLEGPIPTVVLFQYGWLLIILAALILGLFLFVRLRSSSKRTPIHPGSS